MFSYLVCLTLWTYSGPLPSNITSSSLKRIVGYPILRMQPKITLLLSAMSKQNFSPAKYSNNYMEDLNCVDEWFDKYQIGEFYAS